MLLLVIVFGKLTFVAFCARVPICTPRSVKDYYTFELRDPTCPLSDELHERLPFVAVTEARKFPQHYAID